ncbi:MAG: DUF3795 domain-containing protein [Candidatus Eisenbacteria sp.]|nr:DUF3795 domain-containing protein [Candidatus Eisenbacteria bacterium]
MAGPSRKMVAYCGLYCGDCFAYQGKIADLARDLRKELRQAKFAITAEAMSGISFFSALKHYPECYDALGVMVKLRCKRTCRGGGGDPYCKIRTCARKKELEGCWECDEFETCKKMDFLRTNHGGAHLKNLRKIKRQGMKAFLEGKKHWASNVGK